MSCFSSPPQPASSITNPNSTTQHQINGSSSSVSNRSTMPSSQYEEKVMVIGSVFQYQALLTMSYAVFMELITISYKRVKGIIFPETLFSSNPTLFQVFLILNGFSFTSSVIGHWFEGNYTRINKYLWLFAFSTFIISIFIYIGDLLPSHLHFIPIILLLAIFVVLLYVVKNAQQPVLNTNIMVVPQITW